MEKYCQELRRTVREVRSWMRQKDLSNMEGKQHIWNFLLNILVWKPSDYKPVFILICLMSGFQGSDLP